MGLKVGDQFPSVTFKYIPYTPETSDIIACGNPENYNSHEVISPIPKFSAELFRDGAILPWYLDSTEFRNLKGRK